MTQGIPPLREQQESEFRAAVAGAVAACAVDTAARDLLLTGTVELWRSVYGATPEEAEAALAAALEERGQGEK